MFGCSTPPPLTPAGALPEGVPAIPGASGQSAAPAAPMPSTGVVPPGNAGKPPLAPGSAFKPGAKPPKYFQPVSFASISGWGRDDVREAWPAFTNSCNVLAKRPEWSEACAISRSVDGRNLKAVRTFFESFFTPYRVLNTDGTDNGLVTGYYEPVLNGARKRGGAYQTPLYRAPTDMLTIDLAGQYPELKSLRLRGRVVGNKVVPYYSRSELEGSGKLNGSEVLWVDNAIDAFFLQVQGSGRVRLADSNETVRLAYADQNGYPYQSIGRYLVDKGEMTLDQASAQSIKAWYVAHPARQKELLNANPSVVFFKEEKLPDPALGPKGALGVPLTPQRSIAVDTQFVPLGVPVFLATTHPNTEAPLQRLMMAQDTGGAIRSAVRADFFWGFGNDAGDKAGKMKQRGSMWVLLPKAVNVQ
ncbi:MAG: MltA domain-containing protein [Janthinobacterium lividum]